MENAVGIGEKLENIFRIKIRRFEEGKFNQNLTRVRWKCAYTFLIFINWKE